MLNLSFLAMIYVLVSMAERGRDAKGRVTSLSARYDGPNDASVTPVIR